MQGKSRRGEELLESWGKSVWEGKQLDGANNSSSRRDCVECKGGVGKEMKVKTGRQVKGVRSEGLQKEASKTGAHQ